MCLTERQEEERWRRGGEGNSKSESVIEKVNITVFSDMDHLSGLSSSFDSKVPHALKMITYVPQLDCFNFNSPCPLLVF